MSFQRPIMISLIAARIFYIKMTTKKNFEYSDIELAEIAKKNQDFKSPAFQFYVNDALGSNRIMMLSDIEFRAYFNLLYAAWNEKDCGLPTTVDGLVRLSRVSGSLSGSNIETIKQFFFEYEGRLYNRRLLEERIKQIKKREINRENINKRYQNPTKTLPKTLPPKGLSVNEIEKETEIENNNIRKEYYLGIYNHFLPPELQADWCSLIDYYNDRRDIVLNRSTVTAQIKFLREHIKDAKRIMEETIRNNWKGLFELKENKNESHKPTTQRNVRDDFDISKSEYKYNQ